MIVKLAWKNIWRNRRRSIITVSAIAFAVMSAVLMRSMQKGMEDQMLDSMVHNNMGYIQIHANGYWDDPTLNNGFYPDNELINKVEALPNVSAVDKKLEAGTLSSTGNISRGTYIMSYDQNKDLPEMITNNISSGNLPNPDQSEILMGEDLAAYMELEIGDTVIFYGGGYHGATAAGLFVLSGTIDMHVPELNQTAAYMSMDQLQEFLGAPGLVTSLMIDLKKPENIDQTKKDIKNITGSAYEVMKWSEMQPELAQTLAASSSKGMIMNFILYMIIAFVMFGTVIMATQERKYELGVTLAIGMKKWKSMLMISLENLIISLIGAIIGILMVIPFAYYFHENPIHIKGDQAATMENMGFEPVIPFSIDPSIALHHATIVFVIALVLLIYPIRVIKKLKPVEAMKL